MSFNRVNFGCGMTPTPGWVNFDNSFSIKLASFFWLAKILCKLGIISKQSLNYISFCKQNKIFWADATKKTFLADQSVDVIYTSHMVEHLDKVEFKNFLIEVKRLLIPGGTLRIVVPDLEKLVKIYNKNRDADNFIQATGMCISNPKKMLDKLKFLFFGFRHHLWMFDSISLTNFLKKNGFTKIKVLKPGQTLIVKPGKLNLRERAHQSLYIEART